MKRIITEDALAGFREHLLAEERSNVWREMKALCRQAGVRGEKVFPHNLSGLFHKFTIGMADFSWIIEKLAVMRSGFVVLLVSILWWQASPGHRYNQGEACQLDVYCCAFSFSTSARSCWICASFSASVFS